jgi:hypothetical protein
MVMDPKDEAKVARALDLLRQEGGEADEAALRAQAPEIMERARRRADELVAARHRRRVLVALIVLALVAGGALAAALFVKRPGEKKKTEAPRENKDLDETFKNLHDREEPNVTLEWKEDKKALAAEMERRYEALIKQYPEDAAIINSQLKAELKALESR